MGTFLLEFRSSERRSIGVGAETINISLERQEKLGVSGWVKVPVEKV